MAYLSDGEREICKVFKCLLQVCASVYMGTGRLSVASGVIFPWATAPAAVLLD